jgi:hypothetical protein
MDEDYQMVNYQQETKRVNQHPLSQQAKKALITVREKPEENAPYLLQLLEWAIEGEKIKLPGIPARQDGLKETVRGMITWPPQVILEVLTTTSIGEEVDLMQKGPISPLWLAIDLLDQLNSRIIAAGAYLDQRGKDYD